MEFVEEKCQLADEALNVWLSENICGWRTFRPSEVKYASSHQQENYGWDQGLHILPKDKRPRTHMIDSKPLPDFCNSITYTFQLLDILRKQWYTRNPNEADYITMTDCGEYGWRVDILWAHHDGDIPESRAVNLNLSRAICEAIYLAEHRNNKNG